MQQIMCRSVFVIACQILAAITVAELKPVVAEVPDLIPSDQPGRSAPMWRSAAALTDEKGGLRLELFSAYELDELQSRRAFYSGRDCVRQGPTITDNTYFESIEVSLAHSKAVYSGTVLGVKQGMLNRFIGSLYEIRVDEVLLPQEPTQIPKRLFVFYPVGRFTVGNEAFCGGGMRFKERPLIGGRMLVFSFTLAKNEDVVQPADSGLFFDADDGLLSLPVHPDLKDLRSLPLSHIEEQVRKAIRATARTN